MLLFGQMDHGGPFWCYVAVKPSQYEAFEAAKVAGTINLYDFDDFGEVVVSAEGERPPGHVTAEVARMYGADARKFFQEIDPIAEINRRMEEMSPEKPPSDGRPTWASRFKKRS